MSRPAYGWAAAWTRWTAACRNFVVVGIVTEAQMTALFGEGRHPNADVIERRLQREGVHGRALDRATKLGHAYHLFEPSEFQTALAARYREFNTSRGERPHAASPGGGAGADPHRAGARLVPRRTRPRPTRCARVHRLPDPDLASGAGAGGRLRPDVLAGQERVGVVGDRATRACRDDRRVPRRGGAGHDRLAGEARRLHPPRHQRHRPGRHHWADRGSLHAPRLPRGRSGSAHPRRRRRTRSAPPMVDGCRWTDGRCTGTRSPHPSTTTPGWKRCSPSGSGCGSPTAATPPTASGRSARSSESTRSCCAAGRRGAATSRPNSPSWPAGSRTSTPVRRRSSSGRSWPSKRRCPPGRRSTNRARRPSNAAPGGADAGEILGGAERVDELVRRVIGHASAPAPTVDVDILAQQVIDDRAGVPGHVAGASRARRG